MVDVGTDATATTNSTMPEDAAGAELREHRRKRVMWAGKIEVDRRSIDGVVLDVSLTGAKVRVKTPVPATGKGRLKLERFGSLRSTVVWEHGEAVGLRFLETPERVREFFAGSLVL